MRQTESLEARWVLDGSAPSVIAMTGPSLSDEVTIEFSEAVTGVDLADFRLERNSSPFDFAGAELTISGPAVVVVKLPELYEGNYTLSLVAQDSGIADLQNDLLLMGSQISWTAPNIAPEVQISYSAPAPALPSLVRIAALGDSLTLEDTGSYVTSLRESFSCEQFEFSSFAAGGRKVSQIREAWETEVRDQSYDTVIFFGGMNDLLSSTQTPAEIFEQLRSLYDEALARQMHVISVGITPWAQFRASTPARAIDTLTLNSLIRNYSLQNPDHITFVETYTTFLKPGDLYRMDPRYDVGDGLHYSPAGDEALRDLIAPAIELRQPASPIFNTAVLTFTEPITALTETQVLLEREGLPVDFDLRQLSDRLYEVDFLTSDEDVSQYRLAIRTGTNPVTDLAGNALAGGAELTWQHDTISPVAELSLTGPAISSVAVQQIQLTVSEEVTGLDVSDFVLRRNGALVDISTASLSSPGPGAWTLDLGSLAATEGEYWLTLKTGLSGIVDEHLNVLDRNARLQWITLSSPIALVGETLIISGTETQESINVVITDDQVDLSMNGLDLSIDLAGAASVQILPRGGLDFVSVDVEEGSPVTGLQINSSDQIDTVYLYDSAGDDEFYADEMDSTLTNAAWAASATGFARTVAIGRGGQDSAVLSDSLLDDVFSGREFLSTFSGPHFANVAAGFSDISAVSTAGNDLANLFGTAGNDQLLSSPDSATLSGRHYVRTASGFDRVNAFASGGYDQAELLGSSAADNLIAHPHVSVLRGTGYANYGYGFDFVIAVGNGGADFGQLYDAVGNDTFTSAPVSSSLSGLGFSIAAVDFPRLSARSLNGDDQATLVGDNGNDLFSASAETASLTTNGFSVSLSGFSSVQADGAGGINTAQLHDSAGDDAFSATAAVTQMSGSGYRNSTVRFQRVNAFATSGNDTAVLRGDSGRDVFIGQSAYGSLVGTGFHNMAFGFDSVTAGSRGGNDVATLFGTDRNETFDIAPGRASLTGGNTSYAVRGFSSVRAFAGAGTDRAVLRGTVGAESVLARPNSVSIAGTEYIGAALNFDVVSVIGGGGVDNANLYDSDGNDTLTARSGHVNLSGPGFSTTVLGFSRVNSYATSGVDRASLTGSATSDTFIGRPTYSSLSSATQFAYAKGFDHVSASGGGGVDSARFFDGAGNDNFHVSYRAATLSGTGFTTGVIAFAGISALSESGTDSVTYSENPANDRFTGFDSYGIFRGVNFHCSVFDFEVVTLFPASRGINMFAIRDLQYTLNVGAGWLPLP